LANNSGYSEWGIADALGIPIKQLLPASLFLPFMGGFSERFGLKGLAGCQGVPRQS
jgi:hypothetical protein